MDAYLRQLRDALQDLSSLMYGSLLHTALTEEAGVSLDRALLPLLLRIQRIGPVGVEDLAKMVGRDQSTISRQLAKLEQLGLVARKPALADARVREAVLTARGRATADAVNAARERLAVLALANWSEKEKRDFVHLIHKFVTEVSTNLSGRGI
jgi:DNA-binding MarR family transcriptional regulator